MGWTPTSVEPLATRPAAARHCNQSKNDGDDDGPVLSSSSSPYPGDCMVFSHKDGLQRRSHPRGVLRRLLSHPGTRRPHGAFPGVETWLTAAAGRHGQCLGGRGSRAGPARPGSQRVEVHSSLGGHNRRYVWHESVTEGREAVSFVFFFVFRLTQRRGQLGRRHGGYWQGACGCASEGRGEGAVEHARGQ